MVHGPDVLVDDGSSGNEHALVDIVADAGVGDTQGRERVHPVRLLQEDGRVAQVGDIRPVWQTVGADHAVDLLLGFALGQGVLH